jgi:hypothetical protein
MDPFGACTSGYFYGYVYEGNVEQCEYLQVLTIHHKILDVLPVSMKRSKAIREPVLHSGSSASNGVEVQVLFRANAI